MQQKIFSNLLTRVFSDKKIRGMISCLSRNKDIKNYTTMIYINKYNKKKDTYNKKIDSCKVINLEDAIKYLKKEQEQETQKHQKTRQTWLKILLFVSENIELLKELHENPTKTNILDELKEEKKKRRIDEIENI